MGSFESGNRARDDESFLDWEGRATLFEDEDATDEEELEDEDEVPRRRRGARQGDPGLEARDDDEDEEDEEDEDDEGEDAEADPEEDL